MSLLSHVLLRYPALGRLRRLPWIGPAARSFARRTVPREELVWASVRAGPGKGLRLKLNPRTGAPYSAGEVEREVQDALARHVVPGAVVYDVGSNVGFLALLSARLAGPRGRVFAFEPDPEVARRLRENVAQNGFANVEVLERAAWSTSGRVSFARADQATTPDLGLGRVTPEATGTSVEAIALDDLIARGAPPPDLIKCDVEGAEGEVLKGAAKILGEHRPIVIVELHSEFGAGPVEESRKILESFGYRLEPLDARQVVAFPPRGSSA